MADWPQLARTAARTAYAPESLPGFTPTVAWTHPFAPARVHPQAQPLIVGANVYLATEGGAGVPPRAYGFTLAAGARPSGWGADALPLPAGCHHSGASDGTRVVWGCDRGWVVAQQASNGTQAWAVQPGAGRGDGSERGGFFAAPCYVGSKMIVAGEDGYVYALNPATGATLWSYAAGYPCLSSPSSDGTNVYQTDFACRLHAIRLSDGAAAPGWGTNPVQLDGIGSLAYYPVTTDGLVIVAPAMGRYQLNCMLMPGAPFNGGHRSDNPSAVATYGPELAAGDLTTWSAPTVAWFKNPQDALMAAYTANPQNYHPSYQVRSATDGTAAGSFPHGHQAHDGESAPAAVLETGQIVVPTWLWEHGFGIVDLTGPYARRCTDPLYDGTGNGVGNEDESLNVTACPNAFLTLPGNNTALAHFTGVWDRAGHAWHGVDSGKNDYRLATSVYGGGVNAPALGSGSTGTVHTANCEMHELLVRTWA